MDFSLWHLLSDPALKGSMTFMRRLTTRRITLFALLGLVVVALLSSALIFTSTINAQQKAASALQHRVHPFLTRQGWGKQHPGAAPPASGTIQGGGDLTWNGGPIEEQPRIFLIFWGASWNNGSGGLTPDGQIAKNYFTDVGNSAFENILTQYGDQNAWASIKLNLGGTWLDTSNPPVNSNACGGPTVDAIPLENEVNNAINANGWPRDLNNSTYIVYTPSNYFLSIGGANSGFCSEQAFCAYHNFSYTAGVEVVGIPYPSGQAGQGGTSGCMVPNSPNNNLAGDSLANLSSVEQFDAILDPQATGWADPTGFEIGDKCAWNFSAGQTTLHNGGTFELQTEYSNHDHDCVNSYTYMQTNEAGVSVITPPATNAAPQSITLSNRGLSAFSWSVGSLPSWLSVSPTNGSLASGWAQTLTLTFNTSAAQQVYKGAFTLSDPNGAQGPLTLPVEVVQGNLAKTWYFAEGYTGGSFSTWLTIANPNQAIANVSVIYLLGNGGTPIVKQYQVGAQARYTVNVNKEVGAGQEVSMVVNSDQPIAAERPMYFTYNLLGNNAPIPGGSDVLGATQQSQQFDFGYLDTTAGHDTWLTVLNQNPGPNSMNVTIQYYPQAGGNPTTVQHQIAPNSRGTIYVNGDVPAGTYSALVTLDMPGLVERPMYLVDGTTHYTGSTDVIGVTSPQTDWNFAEGYTNPNFSERYILSNPDIKGTASGTLKLFLSNGTTQTQPFTLAPGAQQIINVNGILGSSGVSNSAQVIATSPILAERFMSFNYFGIPGASDVLGTNVASHAFVFAEGYTGGQFGEWLTIENPDSSQTATVIITFLPSSGSAPTARVYHIAPNSRFTLLTNNIMPNQSFSTLVVSDVSIVAERPIYFNYYGDTGGSDVIGYQP